MASRITGGTISRVVKSAAKNGTASTASLDIGANEGSFRHDLQDQTLAGHAHRSRPPEQGISVATCALFMPRICLDTRTPVVISERRARLAQEPAVSAVTAFPPALTN